MDWWLPPQASTFAGGIDTMFFVILAITGIIFVGVEIGLIYFIFKYRGREGRKAHYIEGSTKAEVIWTVIPAIIIVGLGLASTSAWSSIKARDNFPEDALKMSVQAEQFEWNFTYPGLDGELGTDDDFVKRNQLHVPVDRPVVINMTSIDVIHSFFVPAFRVKQDVMPGMELPVWFEATQTGEYELACAELCGLGHYRMKASVTVHPQDAYEGWVQTEGASAAGDN